ncbi:cytochrome b [Salinisphaera hydrothermalis]|uniref:Cytochrome b561 family protein n=1 Tax=Salinisphaera hydrothermalis (strain C41B8) TaxID=1304275 RepID=A0A084IGJ5_SALHC|nr:cytochrome b [Salinisphaera hydrothermalis]KEZ75829.1 cytochrome b561 family protein [Salinisphaera hydrothermalis C41B8]
MEDSSASYGVISRYLHWLLALLIFAQFSLIFVFTWIAPEHGSEHHEHAHQSSGFHETAMMLHKSIGVLILLFGLILIVWRLTQPKPSLEMDPVWQRVLARLVHLVIYVIVIAQPLFGMLMLTSHGQSVPFFGLFSIPAFVSFGANVGETLGALHAFTGWWIVLAPVGIHIAGALYHHFVRKDDVLKRMWRGRPNTE